MKNESYTQCKFERGSTHGLQETTGWIPSWAAQVRNKVQLLEFDEKFWVITWCSEPHAAEQVNSRSRDHILIVAKDMSRRRTK